MTTEEILAKAEGLIPPPARRQDATSADVLLAINTLSDIRALRPLLQP